MRGEDYQSTLKVLWKDFSEGWRWYLPLLAGIAEMLSRSLRDAKARWTEFSGVGRTERRTFSVTHQDTCSRPLSQSGNFYLLFAHEQAVDDKSCAHEKRDYSGNPYAAEDGRVAGRALAAQNNALH